MPASAPSVHLGAAAVPVEALLGHLADLHLELARLEADARSWIRLLVLRSSVRPEGIQGALPSTLPAARVVQRRASVLESSTAAGSLSAEVW